MYITATELKAPMGRYLNAVKDEDVYVTRNGSIVAKISSPEKERATLLDNLVGMASTVSLTANEARKERLEHV